MKNVLVTGVAGFIGSHVAQALLKRKIEVIGLDNLNDYYPVRFKEENLHRLETFPGFTFHKLDISNLDGLDEVFRRHRPSHIAHLAARAGVRPSIAEPFLYEQANIHGTLALLEKARLYNIENFVLTSSSSVYGNSQQIPFREDDSATDRPISPYAATKKATEVIAHTYHHLYGLNINVIRPFTVYGPAGRPDMAPWLFIDAALKRQAIKKFGGGETRRDYTYIDDFVAGFINAIERPLGYEIFNLGNSATVSLNEFITIVEQITGRKLLIDNYPAQPGDVDLTNADISRARNYLSYAPQTSFPEGMEKFYRWFLEHRQNQ
ncbi:MAG: GDP-mannose 4,6-dehydratase [bacterium]|nr:GDP-mannose 4,6-dehydratase [bacterium]